MEFTLYPVNKSREAVEKVCLPDVIQTLISTSNPRHLQKIKGIDVEVSTRGEQGILHELLVKMCFIVTLFIHHDTGHFDL